MGSNGRWDDAWKARRRPLAGWRMGGSVMSAGVRRRGLLTRSGAPCPVHPALSCPECAHCHLRRLEGQQGERLRERRVKSAVPRSCGRRPPRAGPSFLRSQVSRAPSAAGDHRWGSAAVSPNAPLWAAWWAWAHEHPVPRALRRAATPLLAPTTTAARPLDRVQAPLATPHLLTARRPTRPPAHPAPCTLTRCMQA